MMLPVPLLGRLGNDFRFPECNLFYYLLFSKCSGRLISLLPFQSDLAAHSS